MTVAAAARWPGQRRDDRREAGRVPGRVRGTIGRMTQLRRLGDAPHYTTVRTLPDRRRRDRRYR